MIITLIQSLGIVGFLLAIIALILWFLLPFAVFGIKDRLNKLIELNEEIRDVLKKDNKK